MLVESILLKVALEAKNMSFERGDIVQLSSDHDGHFKGERAIVYESSCGEDLSHFRIRFLTQNYVSKDYDEYPKTMFTKAF